MRAGPEARPGSRRPSFALSPGSAEHIRMPTMADPFDLERFVSAQEGVHEQALRELQAGRKRSHWMWFVFPQARGLGRSPMAQHYGVGSLAEARAYLAHPVLGPRLLSCAQAVLDCGEASLHRIFGS